MKLNKLLKDLKTERVQGSSAVLNYSNFDFWVNWDDIVEIVENHKQPSLNENQQIVLDWLKAVYRENDIDAFTTILDLLRPTTLEDEQDSAYAALSRLKEADQFQVLAAFAEWGMKQ